MDQPSLGDYSLRARSTQDFILGYLQPSLRDSPKEGHGSNRAENLRCILGASAAGVRFSLRCR
jgi:hypothetical protein